MAVHRECEFVREYAHGLCVELRLAIPECGEARREHQRLAHEAASREGGAEPGEQPPHRRPCSRGRAQRLGSGQQ